MPEALENAPKTYKASVEVTWAGGYEKGRQVVDAHLTNLMSQICDELADPAIHLTFSEVPRG